MLSIGRFPHFPPNLAPGASIPSFQILPLDATESARYAWRTIELAVQAESKSGAAFLLFSRVWQPFLNYSNDKSRGSQRYQSHNRSDEEELGFRVRA